jgi:hypothetical protein
MKKSNVRRMLYVRFGSVAVIVAETRRLAAYGHNRTLLMHSNAPSPSLDILSLGIKRTNYLLYFAFKRASPRAKSAIPDAAKLRRCKHSLQITNI